MPGIAAPRTRVVAIVGGGPAGLMAAERLAAAGASVDVYDAMPSVGRKFLLAGRGGLNLTHSEPFERFVGRFGERAAALEPSLRRFGPQALQAWCAGLGIDTFVGSSGRVFPRDMKAAPLLRAWLGRLRSLGVRFHMRHRWTGWQPGDPATHLRFQAPGSAGIDLRADADAVVLALGGASWQRLGSDGAWVPWLQARGVRLAPLRPMNCGFDMPWSAFFSERHAGQPFKSVALRFTDSRGRAFDRKGEFVVTRTGVEGSLIYAASALLRDEIEAHGSASPLLDLLPARSLAEVEAAIRHPRGARSLGSHLKSRLGLEGIKSAVLHEVLTREEMNQPERLAAAIKALPLRLLRPRPIDEAISTSGGIAFDAMDANSMLKGLPGVFCAGEMLDWEAPTGGYLLTASMATGEAAARGVLTWCGMGAAVDPGD